MNWVYDTVPQYALAQATVQRFLRERFGNHEFHIEVTIHTCVGTPSIDNECQRYVDEWRFRIPQALTEASFEKPHDSTVHLTINVG